MKVIKRLLQLLILLPVGIVIVSLAVANRHDVKLALDPFFSGTACARFFRSALFHHFRSTFDGSSDRRLHGLGQAGPPSAHCARKNATKRRNGAMRADRQQKRMEKLVSSDGNGQLPELAAPTSTSRDVAKPAGLTLRHRTI